MSTSTSTPNSSSSSHPIPSELITTSTAVMKSAAPEVEFKYFPKLPAELRLKIWNLVPEPRIVEVRFRKDRRKNDHKFMAACPAILHVCQESRIEGLKRYQQAFNSKWALNRGYFDFEIDILYLSVHATFGQKKHFIDRISRRDRESVQRLTDWFRDACYLHHFPQVKELVLLCVHETTRYQHTPFCSSRGVGLRDIEELVSSSPSNKNLEDELIWANNLSSVYLSRLIKQHPNLKMPTTCLRALCEHGLKSRYI